MMTEKKTNEITSKQVLAWARRVGAQRAPKLSIDATKKVKNLMPWNHVLMQYLCSARKWTNNARDARV